MKASGSDIAKVKGTGICIIATDNIKEAFTADAVVGRASAVVVTVGIGEALGEGGMRKKAARK